MNKGAIIIGVHKTGGMTPLPAAIKSAKNFETWAESQGIEVKMHTDENGEVVIVQQIKNSVREFVERQNLSQLIVYFSGHGVLRSANDELWLLSGAPGDSDEAINLTSSIAISRNSRIPHIVFISDACRCTPDDLLTLSVTGSQVFPNSMPPEDRPDVDIFYATIPGSPALELKQKDAADGYRGAFTHCLLEGLNGNVSEVITSHKEGGDVLSIVEAYELKKYLRKAVPIEVEKTNKLLKQIPEAQVTSRLPQYLSKIVSAGKNFNMRGIEGSPRETKLDFTTHENQEYFRTQVFNRIVEVNNEELATSFNFLRNAKGRESFETKTGFTIVGQGIRNAHSVPGSFDIFEENGSPQIRVRRDHIKSIVLELDDRRGVPLAILPGFIGTIVIQDGQVINVNYSPSRNTRRYNDFVSLNDAILDRRAVIATAAKFGRFELRGNGDQLINAASYLRYLKAFDPTLGIYAAYAYAQAGENDGIYSIYKYMRQEAEPVVYDVAMLAKLLNPRDNISLRHTAPFCPMLTQGWSYLSINDSIVSNSIRNLSKFLVPGLWTTFSKKGMERVIETIQIDEFI